MQIMADDIIDAIYKEVIIAVGADVAERVGAATIKAIIKKVLLKKGMVKAGKFVPVVGPFVSILSGIGWGIQRLIVEEGADKALCLAEFTSGIVGALPVVGYASYGIDAALLVRDIVVEVKSLA